MGTSRSRRVALVGVALLLVLAAFPAFAAADHGFGSRYHWQRQQTPFTLKVGDNVDAGWNQALAHGVREWNRSSVLNLDEVAGTLKANACRDGAPRPEGGGNPGRIEVCNADFGDRGYLGITFLLVNDRHIRSAVVAFNDFYLDNPDYPRAYQNQRFRDSVACHELGHALGLGHVNGRDSCMTTSLQFLPEHPNAHDHDELEEMYDHLDDQTRVDGAGGGARDGPVPVITLPTGGEPRRSVTVTNLGGGWQQVKIVNWFNPRLLQE